MATCDAIRKLRAKLGLSQQGFAALLGVTVKSVSRYENGQEPSNQTLEKLANAAEKAKADHLYHLFTAKWRGDVIARRETLQSWGAQRRVSMFELARWKSFQEDIYRACTLILNEELSLSGAEQKTIFKGMQEIAAKTWEDLRAHTGDTGRKELDPNERITGELSSMLGSLPPPEWMAFLLEPRANRIGGAMLGKAGQPPRQRAPAAAFTAAPIGIVKTGQTKVKESDKD